MNPVRSVLFVGRSSEAFRIVQSGRVIWQLVRQLLQCPSRFACTSTVAELAARLGDEEFAEAAGVLEMIAKTPSERNAYDARLKFQRDESARLLYARQEGEAIGEARGRIRLLQQLLDTSESPNIDLDKMDLTALTALAEDLESQLRERR